MLLSLPVFAPEVPAVIEFSPAGERHLRLVLAMSRLGMISDADLSGLRRTRMSASVVRTLIETGWTRAIGGDYTFTLISAFSRLILPSEHDDEVFTSADGDPLVGLAINSAQPEWIAIGKAFTAIEAEVPDLGRVALRVLDSALCHFGIPHTPSGAFDLAQNLYWCGEEDETAAREENDDDCEIPTRADLFGGVPEWAYQSLQKGEAAISHDDFAAHVARLADKPVGKLLATLLRLKELDASNALFAPADEDASWPNEPPIVCGWDDDHDFGRIFDDNFHYHMEGGEEPPWIGCVRFQPTEEGISKAIPLIRHTGGVLKALDQALIEARDLNKNPAQSPAFRGRGVKMGI